MVTRSLVYLLAAGILAGCGGGGSSSSSTPPPVGRGTASVSVDWPARTRFIPSSANSVVIQLTFHGHTVSQTLAREGDGASTGVANFDGLQFGNYKVRVDAYPSSDGTGVSQASSVSSMRVTESDPGTSTVALNTTVKRISVESVEFDKGQTGTLSLVAKDSNGHVVLLEGSGLETTSWTIGTPSVLGFVGDATGPTVVVSGLHSGSSTVQASLVLGGKTFTATATATVNVVDDGTGTVVIS